MSALRKRRPAATTPANDENQSRGGAKARAKDLGLRILGTRPDFDWIPKEQLQIDGRYQRKIKEPRVARFALEWDWIACGCIIIALREDGEWYVIDGGHRVAAAMRRDDIAKLPCLIFDVDNIVQEAQAFLDSNGGRQAMSIAERFNAMRTANDPIALKVDGMIDGTGRAISSSSGPNTVACLAIILKQMKANEKALRAVWPVIVDLYRGKAITNSVIGGFVWLETSLQPGVSLAERHWLGVLRSVGTEAIEDKMISSVSYRKKGGDKSWGLGLVEAINYGRRNKIPVRPERVVD